VLLAFIRVGKKGKIPPSPCFDINDISAINAGSIGKGQGSGQAFGDKGRKEYPPPPVLISMISALSTPAA